MRHFPYGLSRPDSSSPARVCLWLCLGLGLARADFFPAPSWETPLRYSRQDVAFLEWEPYGSFGESRDTREGLWRMAGQVSFPGGSWAGHPLFGSVKSTYIDREISHQGETLNRGPLQRYWLAFGGEVFARGKQKGTVLVGLGHNSDGGFPRSPGWNTEWIYVHSFAVNERLEWGLGLDVQHYFGKAIPYPLVFVDWRFAPATKFRWDADYIEVRHFLWDGFSMGLGVRFNLEFFQLGKNGSYEYQSVGGETGLEYAVASHVFLRLNYKRLFAGEETLGLPEGGKRARGLPSGNSLRLNIAFGL